MAIENVNAAASDPYATLKSAFMAGKVVQFLDYEGVWWDKSSNYYPEPLDRYRIKPEEPAKAPEPVLACNADKTYTVTSRGTDATVTFSLRRPSDGPEMAIPEPQFPYNIPADPPSTALPAVAGLMRVWADPCWARR